MRKILATASFVALAAAACGGGGSGGLGSAPQTTVAASAPSAPTTQAADTDGGGSVTSNTIPADFPMPIAAGANVTLVIANDVLSEPDYLVQYDVASSTAEELMALYRDFYTQQGMEILEDGLSLLAQSDAHFSAADLGKNGDVISVSLSWAPTS